MAAGESRDFVQSVRVEGAMIAREHAELQRDIALEKDPDEKHLLEFKRDIQHADYMALVSERVAAMSNLGSEQYNAALRQKDEALEARAAELQLKETAITMLTEALVEKDTLLEVQKDALRSAETALEERGPLCQCSCNRSMPRGRS